ncbi:MAG TPA: glycine betaine ABC transporter substrate-binding protein [Ramlibacter sp.]|jgi:osmoprotectant transport system permease protein|uniref:ABC transporter permease/substrate-binding protein n=1 Tax=Ramlibacter sp. TaxID=1917967 RepID=UPI002D6407EA|nr:glycine betaine ABC transporter substrate-binding protein [Ramlibacter sp.]HZY20043.1 glycine betaine ABC transporter substrate-binding protein [Ramlibacter sp.]
MPAIARFAACALVLVVACLAAVSTAQAAAVVGSKRFTESYLLGELARQALVAAGLPAEHRQGLGNTAVMEQALANGSIDLYPEYTGTIVRELLKRPGAPGAPSLAQLNAWLAPRGLKVAVPLGFDNSYALAMREDLAQRLGIATLSDLARAGAGLRLGLSHEFLVREDGWPALRRAYGLALAPGAGLDHGLAYQALASGQVDVVDAYTTDAQIARLRLRVLRDDRGFFPRYDAVLLMRSTVDPAPLERALAGRIDAAAMRAMNAQVEIDGQPFDAVARDFLGGRASRSAAGSSGAPAATPRRPGFWAHLLAPDLPRLLREHLTLVFASTAIAAAIGVPMGVLAHRRPRLAGVLFAAAGLVQPLPSLALLAFLIALLGTIGFAPALLALSVYALLPIVRNTHAGLASLPVGVRQAGLALGMREMQVLGSIELPLAAPVVFAGIKTAAVLNVGTATVATFIGAGGLGERIVAGLAVNDTAFMLAGAVPAAALALLLQWGFDALERRLRGPLAAQATRT